MSSTQKTSLKGQEVDLSMLEASGAKGATATKEEAATYLRQELYPAVSVPTKQEESGKQRGSQENQELLKSTTQQEVDAAKISAGKKASLKSQDAVAAKEVADVQGSASASAERRASAKSQDAVAAKEVADVKGSASASAERRASAKSQDAVATKEAAVVKGSASASAERRASANSQDAVAAKEAADVKGSASASAERRASAKSQDAVAAKEAADVKGSASASAERRASAKSQDAVAAKEAKGAERKEQDELRSLLFAAEQKLKVCQQELEVEQQAASDESIVVASLLAQLTAEKRRQSAVESEAQARQLEMERAEAETRTQLEAAKQLRLEAFTAAQEAHHLKTESSEAAYVLSECKAALERHDAEEKRDSELAEENKELEAALKVEAAIVEELRDLCSSESKCYTVAMSAA
eukprot:s144_g7.t1